MRRGKLILLALLLAVMPAKAQFYTLGDEPGSLKWSTVETPTYRIVYPRGLDSLARVYARYLENSADAVGGSIGYRPNSAYRKKMPVILHSGSVSSNGMVTWTPRRMELYTTPKAYSPDVIPWIEDLAIHESRHVAQMQFGKQDFRFWNFLAGEFAPAALSAIYPGPAFFEGDAVVAETALSDAGRGRSGDFLDYMRASFAAGDFRDYWQWRYGSQRYYTPDHYRVGYITMAGMRTLYDVPDFTARYYERIRKHHGVAFNNFGKTVRETTGLKFKEAFRQICESLDSTWRAEAAQRGPFMASKQVSPDPRRFSSFENLESFGDSLYAVRRSLTRTPELIKISSDGGQRKLSNFAFSTSRLKLSANDRHLYWSEETPDLRWSLKSYSDVYYLDYDLRKKSLTTHQRYFNPSPAPDKDEIAVTEYLSDGSCAVTVISSLDGQRLKSWKAPDGMQIVETEWLDGKIYATAITDDGFGIWEIPSFRIVLAPQKVKIKSLGADYGSLNFISDLTGVNEFYSIIPDGSSSALQLTSTANGAGDFAFHKDTLFYTILEPDGRKVYKTAVSELKAVPADFSTGRHAYAMAEELSSTEPLQPDFSADCEISAPKNYSKPGHLLKFHSWAPVFVQYDEVDDISFATLEETAGAGATAFFHNDLSSATGYAGIKFDPLREWRPSAHLKFDYRGWYPVIEASLDVNDRNAVNYSLVKEDDKIRTSADVLSAPLTMLTLKAYVPFNLSSGSWSRGFIPQIYTTLYNDRFRGDNMSRLTASVRGYTILSTASSCIYPRLGIGVEAGYSLRPGVTDYFCANAYGYVYGYLPGFHPTHGIRLTALGQLHASDGLFTDTFAATAPRGFFAATNKTLSAYDRQAKLTFDYALPFAPVGWSGLCPFFYVRNFELTLHSDLTLYSSPKADVSGNLVSAGADFAVRLGNFLWVPYDTKVGVSYNRLCGSGFDLIAEITGFTGRNSIEMIFTVDF